MSEVFSPQHLLLDIDVNDQKQAFNAIAKLARELGITNDSQGLVNDLIKREEISTTGMSDGVAIPHAMSADFNKPAIIVARFKNAIDWKAFNDKPVKIAFALLIPEKDRGSLHMQYLQNIATALLNEDFNNVILTSNDRQQIIKTINDAIENKLNNKTSEENIVEQNIQFKGLIVGVSACATGVAHTYMAREALEKHAKDIGYEVWIETQGQSGPDHKLTPEMIKKADYVIIAADINVELDRFGDKKIYITNTNEAINTPVKALENTIGHSRIYDNDQNRSFATNFEAKKQNYFMKHFLNGVSHMIPFVVFSGILYTIIHIVVISVRGNDWIASEHPTDVLAILENVVNTGFELFIGVMGGYIAVSIAGRSALAPGFIASFIASDPDTYLTYGVNWMRNADTGIPNPNHIGETILISHVGLGIIAAIMMGFSAGILVNTFNRFKVNKIVKPIMPIIIIPVICSSLLVFPFIFALSGIMGTLMNWIGAGIAIAGTNPGGRIVIGLMLGAMVGFDMGGPVNKIATATATTLIPIDPSLMGAVAAAIPVSSLGCAVASTIFGRKLFDNEEKGLGITAYFLGFMGISEGAIPFAAKRLKQTVVANIIGSAIAGLLSSLFYVGGHVGMWGGLIIIFTVGVYAGGGTISTNIPKPFSYDGIGGASWQNVLVSSIWYLIAIVIAVIIHALIYVALIKMSSKKKTTNKLKDFFKKFFSKKNKIDENKKQINYLNMVITNNWYYRYKIKNERMIDW